jgi:hypothetical protein
MVSLDKSEIQDHPAAGGRMRRSRALALVLGIAGAVGLTLASIAVDRRVAIETGLTRTVSIETDDEARTLPPTTTHDIGLAFLEDFPEAPRRHFSVRWEGYWRVGRDGAVDLYAGGDDRVVLRLNGETLLERNAATGSRTISRQVMLRAGVHRISVEFEQAGGGYSLNVLWAPAGGRPRTFAAESLFPTRPAAADLWMLDALRALKQVGWAAWILVAGVLIWPVVGPLASHGGGLLVTHASRLRSKRGEMWSTYAIPALVGAGYLLVLMRWFHDPGVPGADGLLYRSRTVWPFVLLALAFAGVWVRVNRVRLRRLVSEAKDAWPLDRIDGVLLLAVAVAMALYNVPAFRQPAGFFDSDSAVYGLEGKHIADGLVPTAFALGRHVSGAFASHVLAALFVVGGPSVTTVLVFSRVLFLVFLCCHYVLLRFGFGRTVAASATFWLACPGSFLSWTITLTEFGELLAFSGIAMVVIAGRLTDRLKDDWWDVLAGIALGFSFWAHPQTTVVAGAVASTLVSLRGVRQTLRAGGWLAAGFVGGTLPGLVGWGTDVSGHLEWILRGSEGGISLTGAADTLARIAREALPVLFLGHLFPVQVGPMGATVLGTLVVAPAAWALAAGWHARRSGAGWKGGATARVSSRTAVRMLLGFLVLFALVAFTVSRFGYLIYPPRRLILLYAGVPALVAAAAGALLRPLPRHLAAGGVVVAMAAWFLVGRAAPSDWVTYGVERSERLAAGVRGLEAAGVKYCEAPFWTTYWLNLATMEQIRCAQYEHYPDPYYRPVVDRHQPRPYRPYVVYNDGDDADAWLRRVRRRLEERGIGYDRVSIPPVEAVIPHRNPP